MDSKALICQACKINQATTVINSHALCAECSIPKFIVNPNLPTLSNIPIEGEFRECRQCRFQTSSTLARCRNCGFVELSLVADDEQEEEKVAPSQATQLTQPPSNPLCWICTGCGYEYNLKNEACQKCRQPYPIPNRAAAIPPSASKPVPQSSLSHGAMQSKVLPPDDDPMEGELSEMSPAPQPAPLTSASQWQCQCGTSNPVFLEICTSCKRQFPQYAHLPWKCIFCAQNTYTDPCEQCKGKQGWSQYLRKKKVTLNDEKWMWQCKTCKLWTRIDTHTCFFGHINDAIKTALEGTASQSKGVFGTLKSLFF